MAWEARSRHRVLCVLWRRRLLEKVPVDGQVRWGSPGSAGAAGSRWEAVPRQVLSPLVSEVHSEPVPGLWQRRGSGVWAHAEHVVRPAELPAPPAPIRPRCPGEPFSGAPTRRRFPLLGVRAAVTGRPANPPESTSVSLSLGPASPAALTHLHTDPGFPQGKGCHVRGRLWESPPERWEIPPMKAGGITPSGPRGISFVLR